MMMTNGFGAVLGSSVSGLVIEHYFTDANGVKDWHSIWLAFAAYALVIAVLFVFLFKHKHNPELVAENMEHTEPLLSWSKPKSQMLQMIGLHRFR